MERASLRPSLLWRRAACPLPLFSKGFCSSAQLQGPSRPPWGLQAGTARSLDPSSCPPTTKMDTQCMFVDPGALPWAAWPTWSPGVYHSLPPTSPAATSSADASAATVAAPADRGPLGPRIPDGHRAPCQRSLVHVLSDQPLLQSASALPSTDPGIGSLRTAADLLRAGHTVAIPTVSM